VKTFLFYPANKPQTHKLVKTEPPSEVVEVMNSGFENSVYLLSARNMLTVFWLCSSVCEQ